MTHFLSRFDSTSCHYIVIMCLVVFLSSWNIPCYAVDFAIYECKSDLAETKGAKISGEDSKIAASSGALTVHDIYLFDFFNKTVSHRILNNEGKESDLPGRGQVGKYKVDAQIDGDKVSWNNVVKESPDGVVTAKNVFNIKSGKLHIVTTNKPATGQQPQSVGEDQSCSTYSFKRH